MAYTTIDKPTDYFDTKLHTGTGASKTLAYDFEVDFYWTKMRSDTYPNVALDSSRGNNALFRVNQTNAEVAAANTVSFGNASGVTLGSDSSDYGVNKSSETFVGWAWKANGGTTSSNTDGSITSTVQADTTAGFSIVTYTGNFTDNSTVGHGLGAIPKVIIIKNRADAYNWVVYHGGLNFPTDDLLYLNLTNAANQHDPTFNNTAPTSSVFTIGAYELSNDNTDGHVAYCFAEKQGYSKFGSYKGNGSTNGPFVYTGFKPAWVMLKRSSGVADWNIFDNKRPGYNETNARLRANDNTAESTSDAGVDLLSNGFKCRLGSEFNADGTTNVYMAFAEHPFVSSRGVPVTAR